jgi:citrate lyase beta subunit
MKIRLDGREMQALAGADLIVFTLPARRQVALGVTIGERRRFSLICDQVRERRDELWDGLGLVASIAKQDIIAARVGVLASFEFGGDDLRLAVRFLDAAIAAIREDLDLLGLFDGRTYGIGGPEFRELAARLESAALTDR